MPIRVLELRSVWGTGGGPEKTILLGAAQGDRRRFEVTVCYLRQASDEIFAIGELARKLDVEYVELVERHSYDPQVWFTLRRLVRARAFDIIHAHDYKTDFLAKLIARTDSVVPLATAHGWTGSSWRERIVYYPADRRLLAGFPRVIAVSDEIRTRLLASGACGDRVTVILNGVDPSVFQRDSDRVREARANLGLDPHTCAIGAIGRLEPQKRLDILIDAIGRVRQNHPRAELLIAGDGSLRAVLETQAQRVAGGGVRFLGHCTDVIGLHHALDCFVQASDYEGTSNSLLEAMAMETPVVATTVGGTASLVRDTVDGSLLSPGDSSAMVRAIERVIEDPEAARVRARCARERVESTFSFAERTRKLEMIYEELMDHA